MNVFDLNFRAAGIRSWWNRLPPTQRRQLYRPAELARATGTPAYDLPTVLAHLGWDRAVHWSRVDGRRVRRTYYAPPGYQVPRPPRGRPSFSLEKIFGVTTPCPYRPHPE
ncbi:MAG: hypothetical protein WAT23_18300 [Chromatiaceae bacterium]